MRRSFLFYVSIISGAAAAIWYVVKSEKHWNRVVQFESLPKVAAEDLFQNGLDTFLANIHHPLAILILQIISIIFVAELWFDIYPNRTTICHWRNNCRDCSWAIASWNVFSRIFAFPFSG